MTVTDKSKMCWSEEQLLKHPQFWATNHPPPQPVRIFTINILHVKPEEWLTCVPDKPKNKAQQLSKRLVALEKKQLLICHDICSLMLKSCEANVNQLNLNQTQPSWFLPVSTVPQQWWSDQKRVRKEAGLRVRCGTSTPCRNCANGHKQRLSTKK